MPAAGSKGAPKNSGEIKDDTNSSREEKKVTFVYITIIRQFCVNNFFYINFYSFSFLVSTVRLFSGHHEFL